MALRWLEGFEGANNNETVHGRIYSNVPTTASTPQDGASSSVDEAYSDDNSFLTTNALVAPVQNSWIIGFAFRPAHGTTINNPDVPYVAMENTDGEQIRIEFLQSNPAISKPGGIYYRLRIMRGAVEIATSDQAFNLEGALVVEGWCYFEFKITIDNSVGAVEGRYRWIQKPSRQAGGVHTTLTWDAAVSGIDTQNQTSAGGDRFTLNTNSGNAGNQTAWDDIYVCDSTGSKNNDFLGKIIIQKHSLPDGAGGEGDTTDWDLVTATSTGDAWEEPHNTNEDDERTTSATTSQIHLGAYDPLPDLISGAPIIGVRKDIHGRMETTGSLDIGHMWRKTTVPSGQIESGTALTVDSTTIVANTVIAEDDPNTATTWVNADLDTYQYGVKNNG